jgi:hypothetical protein
MTTLDDGGGVAVSGSSVAVAAVDAWTKIDIDDCHRMIDQPNARETSHARNPSTDIGIAVDSFGLTNVAAGCEIAGDSLVGG